MTAMLTRRIERIAPTPTKIKGTLLDIVTPTEGVAWGEPTGLYTSYNCLTTDATTAMCPDSRTSKTLQGLSIVDGFRFAVYTGIICKSVGLNWSDVQDELMGIEGRKESQAVEKALMVTRFAGVSGGAAAVDLTPSGGAVSPEVGLAILEGDGAHNYSGVPTIHMPRTIASLLTGPRNALITTGQQFYTQLGSKVAAGSGYEPSFGPSGAAAPTGQMWMYATGEVMLARSPLVSIDPQVNLSTNDVSVLVERVYVASVDCYAAAVRVTVT